MLIGRPSISEDALGGGGGLEPPNGTLMQLPVVVEHTLAVVAQ